MNVQTDIMQIIYLSVMLIITCLAYLILTAPYMLFLILIPYMHDTYNQLPFRLNLERIQIFL